MKKTVILIITLLASLGLRGQTSEEPSVPTVIPPSPDVAALGSFGEIPVGHFTGRAQIDIPLYTVILQGVQIPVKLSYQFMGLQPNAAVGTTGLGWVLDAGGVVSRTVKGRPDEKARFQYADEIQGYLTDGSFDLGGITPDGALDPQRVRDMKVFLEQAQNGGVDLEPDVFNYSAPFGGGQLFFDWDANPVMIPANDIQLVTPYDNKPLSSFSDSDNLAYFSPGQGFEFTTIDGIQYNFKEQEIGRSDRSPNYPGMFGYYQSAWHISSIIGTNGRTVDYTYFSSPGYELASKSVQHSGTVVLASAACASGCQDHNFQTSYTESWHQPHYLQEMAYADGKIMFYYSDQRADMGTWQLDSLCQLDANGDRISSYHLEYNYFGGGTSSKYLKLERVIKIGSDGQSDMVYELEYNEQYNFPTWQTTGLDHYGYYNGQNDNVKLYMYTTASGQNIGGISREPNGDFSSLGALKKITYPTGGHSEFTFEPHSFSNAQGVVSYQTKQVIVAARKGGDGSDGQVPCSALVGTPLECQESVSETVTVPDQSINIRVFVEIELNGQATSPVDPVDVRVFRDGNLVSIYYATTSDWIDLPEEAGEYEIIARASLNGTRSKGTLSWQERDEITMGNLGGGLRIKEIASYSNASTLARKVKYDFLMEDGEPSGLTFGNSVPRYAVEFDVDNEVSAANGGIGVSIHQYRKVSLSGTSQAALGSTSGASIGYRRVIEYQEDEQGNTNGKQVYEFTVTPDKPSPSGQNFPFQLRDGLSWKRGLATNHMVFKGNAPNYSKISEQQNAYIYHDETNERGNEHYMPIFGLKLYKYLHYQKDGAPFYENTLYDYGTYNVIPGWHYMQSNVTKSYGTENETDFLENTTIYTYGNVNHHLPTSQTVSGPEQENITTVFTYSHDLAQTGNIYELLVSRNKIGTPVKTETFRNGNPLSTQRTEYFNYGNNNLLPQTVYTQRIGFPEETRIIFHQYDDIYGNPLEFSKAGDIHTSILWDENKLRPIAKVINASQNQIWHTSFEEDSWHTNYVEYGAWTGNKAKKDPTINVPDLPAGNYVVSYWVNPCNDAACPEWQLEIEEVYLANGYSATLTGVIDEFRIYPAEAQMTTITYDAAGRTLTECEVNGHVIRYTYDAFGRLQAIKDKEGNLLKAFKYHYHND